MYDEENIEINYQYSQHITKKHFIIMNNYKKYSYLPKDLKFYITTILPLNT
jgi:hypothetical protein